MTEKRLNFEVKKPTGLLKIGGLVRVDFDLD